MNRFSSGLESFHQWRFFAVLALSLLLISCSSNQSLLQHVSFLSHDYKHVQLKSTEFIQSQMEEHSLESVTVALIHGQEVIWSGGFGYADRESQIPATADTVYRVGSISKPFTALAMMQLAERGEVDIDQPLQAYIPNFSVRSRFTPILEFISPRPEDRGETIYRIVGENIITLRSALTHHSGLQTDLNKGMYTAMPLSALAEKMSEENTAYPPDLVYSYSNVGYSLLGHAIEKVSGQGYAEYMEQNLLSPLGMNNSSFVRTAAVEKNLAIGYRDGRMSGQLPIRDLPAMGLYTSANDLSQFIKMFFAGGKLNGHELVMEETLEEMFELQNEDVALDLNVHNGIGWFLEKETIEGGGLVVRHGGTTLLFNGEMILLPEHKLGVVVLSNSSGSRKVLTKIAKEILTHTVRDLPPLRPDNMFLVEDFPIPEADYGHVIVGGGYSTDLGMLQLNRDNDQLEIEGSSKRFDLIPYPGGWFGLHQDAVDTLPSSLKVLGKVQLSTREVDGRKVIYAKRGDKRVLLGEQAPTEPVPQKWLDRVGRYELINPDPDFPLKNPRLRHHDGKLSMSYHLPLLMEDEVHVPLRVLNDDEAVILGLGRTRGETLRVDWIDGKEHLRYSGFIGKKISSN